MRQFNGIPPEEMIAQEDLSPHLRGPIYPENIEDVIPPNLRPSGVFEKATQYLRGMEASKRQKIIGAIVLGVVTYGLARYLANEDDFIGGHNQD